MILPLNTPAHCSEYSYIFCIMCILYIFAFTYTGWLVTGGTSGKGVILR